MDHIAEDDLSGGATNTNGKERMPVVDDIQVGDGVVEGGNQFDGGGKAADHDGDVEKGDVNAVVPHQVVVVVS